MHTSSSPYNIRTTQNGSKRPAPAVLQKKSSFELFKEAFKKKEGFIQKKQGETPQPKRKRRNKPQWQSST
ncbi:hypothetical protein D6783_05025 [Candidatus Woesearchaeota archaeon]|nr:MAG: hypothetical protein D6783_05025 [Candidatus Woesearchaeota archaeon]